VINYVLDSFAMIALFRNELGKELIVKLLNEAIADTAKLHMSSINIGELYYMLCRKNTYNFASQALEKTLKLPIQIHEPSFDETLFAARLKSATKLSFADAHAAALTIRLKAILITGDKEFDNLKSEVHFKVEYL
jgi:predicted nucleic acid-binding protein